MLRSALLFTFLALRTLAASDSDPFETLTIKAFDGSITANFIRAGAHITNLFVKDKVGVFRDIVLGYDDRSLYLSDPAHPYFGPVVGRYANRIKNGALKFAFRFGITPSLRRDLTQTFSPQKPPSHFRGEGRSIRELTRITGSTPCMGASSATTCAFGTSRASPAAA